MIEAINASALISAIAAGAVVRGTPIAFAALGEAVAEKSGVLNLGVEGMMLVGAVTAYIVQVKTQSVFLAFSAAAVAAAILAAVHAGLVIWVQANQIVSGFAITIVGTGISSFFGNPFVGKQIQGLGQCPIPLLHNIPILGDIFFNQDIFVYLSLVAMIGIWFLLYRTRFGLNVRAVGESPEAAYTQGVAVLRTRFLAVVLGGLMAGIGGAHLSVAYTHVWAEKMTAGQGWIAIGLVIVARWNPVACILVAWLFGALMVLHPHLQASGVSISSYLIAMLPYIMAVITLTIVTLIYRRVGHGMPASLARQLKLP